MNPITKKFGNLITKSFSFTRPANTTAYTAKDAVNVGFTVSAASNASPIEITTSEVHGLSNGDYVTISDVGGNTNANGSFFVKFVSTTKFTLYSDKSLTTPVAGNDDYTSGGAIAVCFRLKGIFEDCAGSGFLVKLLAFTSLTTFTDQFRIHLFSQPVAAILDNAAFTVLIANKLKYLGYVDITAFAVSGTGSDAAHSLTVPAAPLAVGNEETGGEETDLWFLIEDLSAGTPASGQTFTLLATVDQN